jgi:hypothetical protein
VARRNRERLQLFHANAARFAEAMPGYWVGAFGGGLPFPVVLRLGESDRGQLACTGLLAGFQIGAQRTINDRSHRDVGPGQRLELTARDVHNLKLGELLDAIARDPNFGSPLGTMPKVKRGKRRKPGPQVDEEKKRRDAQEAWDFVVAHRKRMRSSPYPYLARAKGYSESTARRLLRVAVELGIANEEEL